MIQIARPLVLLSLFFLFGLGAFVWRDFKKFVLRFLTACLLIIALAGPQVGTENIEQNVYFLVDRSPSITRTTDDEILQERIDAITDTNSGFRFGTIFFAEQAQNYTPIGEPLSFPTQAELHLGSTTNLKSAVHTALVSLPKGTPAQLVLVSDGRITHGLAEGISAAQQAGVPISTLSIGTKARGDVSLARLEIPTEVEINRPFIIRATITAHEKEQGTLALYRNDKLLAVDEVSLEEGFTYFRLTDTLAEEGSYTYRAIIKSTDDPFPENDVLSALTRTSEQPHLLVVSPNEPVELQHLLESTRTAFAVRSTIPPLEELSRYRQVLLTGSPLTILPLQAIATLNIFVNELGGSLVVAAGEEELRNFAGGEIESLLPVSYTVPQKGREASLCIVFVLDRSASMRGSTGGVQKIEVLKEAVAASIGLLQADVLVGIIAFDRTFEWFAPIQPLRDGEEIYGRLRELQAAGGTDIYYPLVEAINGLEPVEARLKHILVFSDGKTVDEYRDFPALFSRLSDQDEIALSAVAIGLDPNIPLLRRLAEDGHGTLYRASDFSTLPQISMQATQRLSRSRFITGEIPVTGSLAHGELSEFPALNGYALTYPKPTAEVLLWANQDPLLARWQVGLGRVAVLNTDLAGDWSEHWFSWSKGAFLLDAILSSAEATVSVSSGFVLSTERTAEGILASADALDSQGNYVNFLDLEASFLPSGPERPMPQVAPGLYQTVFETPDEGGYALKVVDHTRDKSAILPITVPYPAEYQKTGIDHETLQLIARETGGRLLEDEILPPVTGRQIPSTYTDLYPHFLLAALALFVVDLGARKLSRSRFFPRR